MLAAKYRDRYMPNPEKSRLRRVPLDYQPVAPDEVLRRAEAFSDLMRRRRSVRMFSGVSVPDAAIRACIQAAGSSPSGANQQPWHFAVVASPEKKALIRQEAEIEERSFYSERASEEWLDALAPIGTDADKGFLEDASHLVAIFQVRHAQSATGERVKHYYPLESVGIATGVLITACHQAGLVTLTHTPSPMRFLNKILGRPSQERPFLLLAVGYPAEAAWVPDIARKKMEEIASFH